jgi:hypothetical protein
MKPGIATPRSSLSLQLYFAAIPKCWVVERSFARLEK